MYVHNVVPVDAYVFCVAGVIKKGIKFREEEAAVLASKC